MANHYFLNHRFNEAAQIYSEILERNNRNDKVKVKLIPCLLKEGKVDYAFALFYELLNHNPLLFPCDNNTEDCPCREVLNEIENDKTTKLSIKDFYLSLAMLYTYCDSFKAKRYFDLIKSLSPENKKYRKTHQLISKLIQNQNSREQL